MDPGKTGEELLGATLRGGSDTVCDFFCEECKEDGNDVDSEGYCLDCQEYLCKECLAVHRKTKLTRQHELLDKQGMKNERLLPYTKVKDMCVEICADHKAEIIKYYCEDHGEFGCSVCATIKHRNCEGLGYIPQLAEELEASDEFQSFKREMNELREGFQYTDQEVKLNLLKADTICGEAVTDVQEFRKDVDRMMDTLEHDVRAHAEQIKKEDTDKLRSVLSKSNAYMQAVEKLQSEFNAFQENKKMCQLFVAMKNRKFQIDALRTGLGEVRNLGGSIRVYQFKPTMAFKSVIALPSAIGSIAVIEPDKTNQCMPVPETQNVTVDLNDKNTNEDIPKILPQADGSIYNIVSDKTGDQHENRPKRSPSEVSAIYMSDFKVRTDSDTSTCYISSCVFLPFDVLVLADFNNSKIKTFNIETFTLKNEFKLSSCPWEVEGVGTYQVATTMPYKNKIAMLMFDDTPTIIKEIPVNGNCRGLVCHKDNFIVTFTSPPKIEIVGFEGVVIRTLVDESKATSLMTLPYHVTINREHEIIYVSDCSQNKIISLTIKGEINAVCKDLKYPRGMHIDTNGFVFVCARDIHVMYVVTPECRNVKSLLTRLDGLHYPMSACCDDEGQKLYVGMEDDTMKVYKL